MDVHSRSFLHRSLLFGAPVALIAGLMSAPIPKWLWFQKQAVALSPRSPVPVELNNIVHSCHCVEQVIGWHEVFLFLKSQAMTIDPQWALLALNLLLVLVQTLSSRKDESEEDDRRGVVSGCEADVAEEEVSKNTKCLPQFNARERALLQFQRIKVEPLSPKYGYAASNDVQDLKENAAKIAAMIRKYSKRHSSKCKELKSAVSAISQETLEAPPPAQTIINDVAALGMPSEQRAYPSPTHSTPRTSCSSRRELKQAFISSPATSEGRSIKHLLRPSPSRSSFFSTEVTQEQVYSQPFTY